VRWTVRGRRRVYTSEWVDVWVDEVQAGAKRFEHHVVRLPKPTISAVVVDDHDRVLLLWRHRFITDSWGWEIPAGWVEPGEELADAARREIEEETGWRPRSVEPLITYNALSGLSSMEMHTFLATDVIEAGPITDEIESTRVEWIPLDQIHRLTAKREIVDGPSLTGLMYYLITRRAGTQ
jgi:8-oxo-dGTP pyrophosphatase MutT (NUDIX family)